MYALESTSGSPAPASDRKAHRLHDLRVVLAAVDVAAEDPLVANGVLSAGYAVATQVGSEHATLHVVHALSFLGDSILSCPLRGAPAARLRTLAFRVAHERRRRIERLCAETLPCPPESVFVHRGDPRSVIPALARRLRADLIVLGCPSRAPVGGLAFGSVAQSLLGRLGCDLLIVGAASTAAGRAAARNPERRR